MAGPDAPEELVLGKESYPAVLHALVLTRAEERSGRNYCDPDIWIQLRDGTFELAVRDVLAISWAIAADCGSKMTYDAIGRAMSPSAIFDNRAKLVKAFMRDFAPIEEDPRLPLASDAASDTPAPASSSASPPPSTPA